MLLKYYGSVKEWWLKCEGMIPLCLVGFEPTKLSPVTLEITEFTNFSTDTRDDRTRTYNNNFGDYYFTIKLHLYVWSLYFRRLNISKLILNWDFRMAGLEPTTSATQKQYSTYWATFLEINGFEPISCSSTSWYSTFKLNLTIYLRLNSYFFF